MSQKTGDYPIIKTKGAEKLLLNGDYVPAVEKSYISNTPTWDGSVN